MNAASMCENMKMEIWKVIKKSAFFAALFFCVPAIAANWQSLSNSGPMHTFEVDKSSVQRHGDIVKMWVRDTYSPPRVRGELPVAVALTHFAYNCIDHTLSMLSYADYDTNNNLVRSHTLQNDPFDDIVPGSTGESAMIFACLWTKK